MQMSYSFTEVNAHYKSIKMHAFLISLIMRELYKIGNRRKSHMFKYASNSRLKIESQLKATCPSTLQSQHPNNWENKDKTSNSINVQMLL